jgi:hypothetical protein
VISNSQFENAGESAIFVDATNVQIVNNLFQNNHSNSIPFNDTGGQIDLSTCTDNAAAVGNVVQNGSVGPNGLYADGIELHGSNLTIVDNAIKNNTGSGIILGSARDVFIANWNQQTAISGNSGSGITVAQFDGFRPVGSIVIDRAADVGNGGWGVWFGNYASGMPINNVTITNNCLNGNTYGPTSLNGLGYSVLIQNNLVSGCGPN